MREASVSRAYLRALPAKHTRGSRLLQAFRLGISRSAATSSKKVGLVEPSPPKDTKDILHSYENNCLCIKPYECMRFKTVAPSCLILL